MEEGLQAMGEDSQKVSTQRKIGVLRDVRRGLEDFWWELGLGDALRCLWAKRQKTSWHGVGYTLGIVLMMATIMGLALVIGLLMGAIYL